MYKATEVFGITRDLPLNYVERDSADKELVDNLTRDKHLVIFKLKARQNEFEKTRAE